MPKQKFLYAGLSFILLGMLVLSACESQSGPAVNELRQTSTLIPYHSPTPTPILATSTPVPPTAAPLPSPTPTYRVHEVKKDEDLGGIAYLYGVSVAALMAVNPDVDPYIMSIGTQLNIPPAQETGDGEDLLPTPVGVQAAKPQCYPSQAQGSWCFSEVNNPLDMAVENVSAVLRIQNPGEDHQQSFDMFAGLNTLPAGETLPLMVYLPFQVQAGYAASIEITSALPLEADTQRYLTVQLENAQVQINGRASATVSGEVRLDSGSSQSAARVWVLATAYDAQHRIVGARRQELNTQVTPGGSVSYNFEVYAAGGSIADVRVRAEAMP